MRVCDELVKYLQALEPKETLDVPAWIVAMADAVGNMYDTYGEAVPTVVLRIKSNHGNRDWTCVYNVQELTDHMIEVGRQRVEFQRMLQDAANRAANAGLADNQIEREAAAARQRRSNDATVRAITPLPENESQPSSTEVSPCSSAKRRASAPDVLESAKRARTASTPPPQTEPAASAKCPYTGDAERWWHEYLAGVAELRKDTDPRVAQVGRHLKPTPSGTLPTLPTRMSTYITERLLTYLQSDPALREAAAALEALVVDDEGISLAANLSFKAEAFTATGLGRYVSRTVYCRSNHYLRYRETVVLGYLFG
ncbi:hypothetical protein HDU88_002740 [Geranomyces variabilis]|nr:hypothetical protein HDU88_002740 [Geranomyces variabilis]